LIPPEILNKNGSLTDEEHKIMDLHTEFGYYLLKTAGVNEKVLNLVRNHHDNYLDNTSGRSYIPDINLQILNIADKYSALTEKRVYKDAYAPQRALTVIYGDVQRGEVHPFLFNALVKSVQESASQTNIKKC
jgi:HD-GYP domain-containing protein (c-di-GMP phosphodiesterase class II)